MKISCDKLGMTSISTFVELSNANVPNCCIAAQDKKPSTGEMFFEVKLDAETKQYKVGTEVNISEEMTHRRTASGSIKLSLTSDELGEEQVLSTTLKWKIDRVLVSFSLQFLKFAQVM